jgi:hypothetical protein
MPRTLFVDFLYAIVVAVSISRISVDMLSIRSVELWGLLFLLYVFLEDFYLYHKEVAPFLKEGPPGAKSLLLEVAIVMSWYLSQTAFPKKIGMFAGFLALFYGLKIVGGVKMTDRMYPSERDTMYIIPVLMGIIVILFVVTETVALVMMASSCIICSILWWFPRKKFSREL